MTDQHDRLRQRIADLRAEIERLDSAAREFDSMLGELDHRTRQVRDGLERAGWRSRALEAELKTLERNRKDAASDRQKNAAELTTLRSDLATIQGRLRALGVAEDS